VPCIDTPASGAIRPSPVANGLHHRRRIWPHGLNCALVALIAGCATGPRDGSTPPSPGLAATKPAAGKPSARSAVALPAPAAPRSWSDARLQAAHRLIAANPDIVYTSKPPDILLAIPVMTIELNGDGSVRHIDVMRYPGQARDTVEVAMMAIRRAAPFGDVSRLPKPWKFNETFLFNDERKFKPMTLDQR
jgi:hypothetical protein